jgi:hypothetical protein
LGSSQDAYEEGDFLIIQFGHNDSSPLNDDKRARGTIRGVGEETEEIDNLITKQHETVHTYGWYLRAFIREAKELGVTPIVCSPCRARSGQTGRSCARRPTAMPLGRVKSPARRRRFCRTQRSRRRPLRSAWRREGEVALR